LPLFAKIRAIRRVAPFVSLIRAYCRHHAVWTLSFMIYSRSVSADSRVQEESLSFWGLTVLKSINISDMLRMWRHRPILERVASKSKKGRLLVDGGGG